MTRAKTNGCVRARKTVRATAPKASACKEGERQRQRRQGVRRRSRDRRQRTTPRRRSCVIRRTKARSCASRARSRRELRAGADAGLTAEAARPEYWDKACADLVKRDRILKKLIPKFGPVHLINRDDPFTTLARSVVGQQISVACRAGHLETRGGACPTLAPQQFIKLGSGRSCSRAGYRSASRNTFSISRSISCRARCTSIAGHRWKTKP